MKIDGISMTDILISWKYRENVKRLSLSGADPGGGGCTRCVPHPKIGKNKIFFA